MPRWLRGAPVAARAADRRLAAARRRNERVLALARLVLLLREARAVRRRHVLLQWPPTMRPHRRRQIQPRRPPRPRLRGCGHPDRRQPLAQPADLYYREQRLCTTCRMASRRSCWSSRGTQGLPVVRDAHLDTTCKERALWALCGVAYGSRNALERFRAAGAFLRNVRGSSKPFPCPGNCHFAHTSQQTAQNYGACSLLPLLHDGR